MNESTLRVEQVELVVQSRPCGSDRRRVGQHAERSRNLGEITAGDERGRFVADTELETGRTPVDELDRSLCLDLGNGGVDVLGDDVTSVEQATGHVLSLSRVTLDHLVVGFETRERHLGDRVGLVECLVGGDDGRVGGEREVDSREGHQVGLEFVQIDVQGTVESQGSGDRGDNLGDQPVQVGVGGRLDTQVSSTDVVDAKRGSAVRLFQGTTPYSRFVVNHERTVRVLQGGVGGQDRVVRLNNRGRHLRGGVNRELQL